MARAISFALLTAVTVPATLAAQPSSPTTISCRDTSQATRRSPAFGVIRGTMIDDSTGKPVAWRFVLLDAGKCMGMTDTAGQFTFHGLPPGAYRVTVPWSVYRDASPLVARVSAGDTTKVELRWQPENLVLDCESLPACADVLHGRGQTVEVPVGDRLREAALRATLALLVLRHWKFNDVVVCMNEAQPQVLASLRRYAVNLAPANQCGLEPIGTITTSSSMRHTLTGRHAVLLSDPRLTPVNGGAEADLSHYVGPLYAEGWKCRFDLTDEGWTARWCRMTWIS